MTDTVDLGRAAQLIQAAGPHTNDTVIEDIFSMVYAIVAWSLPKSGLRLREAALQTYVEKRMAAYVEQSPAAAKRAFVPPAGWSHAANLMAGTVPLERLVNPRGTSDRTVLQIHGGGFIIPLHNVYRARAVLQTTLVNAREAYMVHYRLAPEHPYPAGLDDVFSAYQYLLSKGKNPQDIIVFGDSAGGNLALALSLKLKEAGLPQPALLVLISPWTTMENDAPFRSKNAPKDLILGEGNANLFHEINYPTYVPGGMDAKDPRVSPVYGDLTGLPPMLIQAGGYELLVDDALQLAAKAASDGVQATLSIYPGMPHAFAMHLPELQESIDSYAEIRDWVNVWLRR